MKFIALLILGFSINSFALDDFQGLSFGKPLGKQTLQNIGLPTVCKITCAINHFGNDKFQLVYDPGVSFMGEKRTTVLILGQQEELQQGWIFLPYNKELYLKLKKALKDKYSVAKDITSEDVSNLDKGINHTIAAAFDGGQVLLTITKDPETKKTDMLLMYLDKKSGEDALKHMTQQKKSLKDEI